MNIRVYTSSRGPTGFVADGTKDFPDCRLPYGVTPVGDYHRHNTCASLVEVMGSPLPHNAGATFYGGQDYEIDDGDWQAWLASYERTRRLVIAAYARVWAAGTRTTTYAGRRIEISGRPREGDGYRDGFADALWPATRWIGSTRSKAEIDRVESEIRGAEPISDEDVVLLPERVRRDLAMYHRMGYIAAGWAESP